MPSVLRPWASMTLVRQFRRASPGIASAIGRTGPCELAEVRAACMAAHAGPTTLATSSVAAARCPGKGLSRHGPEFTRKPGRPPPTSRHNERCGAGLCRRWMDAQQATKGADYGSQD